MNKREILLLGIGFLVGYMVIRATKKNVVLNPTTQSLPNTYSETIPPQTPQTVKGTTQIQEPEVVEAVENPKIKACKDKWIRFSETQRFGSQEQMQKTYDNFMTSCVVQS
jgi:hypothetical protein